MEEKVFEAALAGLLHDVGKVAQRAKDDPWNPPSDIEDSGQPVHAAWSLKMASLMPKPYRSAAYAGGYHHQPEKSPAQDIFLSKVVSLADKLSAGERADPQQDQDKKKPPQQMVSIFDKIVIDGHEQKNQHYLPVSPLSLDIIGNYIKSTKTALSDTKDQYDQLRLELESAMKKDIAEPEAYLENILAEMQRLTWCVPSAYYHSLPDISLYDHSRMTAALATCLVEQEPEKVDQLLGAVKRSFEEKPQVGDEAILSQDIALLVGGDISGVQDFIYTITNKGATSALRGRSFYLQLLTEAAARFILRELGLPYTNLIYGGGGNFYILARASDTTILPAARQKLSRILYKHHQGDLYIAIDGLNLKANDFLRPKQKDQKHPLSEKWGELTRLLAVVKNQRFSELTEEELKILLNPQGHGGNEEKQCQVCGREHSKTQTIKKGNNDEGVRKCPACQSYEKLGEELRKAIFIGWKFLTHPAAILECNSIDEPGRYEDLLREMGFEIEVSEDWNRVSSYSHIWALNDDGYENVRNKASGKVLARRLLVNVTPKLAQPFVSDDEQVFDLGDIKPFEKLAKESQGITRLGILRADVDNLGKLFAQGLGTDATLSRIASLSFAFSLFFEGWIGKMAETRNIAHGDRLYAIYSGGDDLFFVGSWDEVAEFAWEVNEDLKNYVGGHPGIHISGGMTLASEKYPLAKAARDAERAEKAAKELVWWDEHGNPHNKNVFSFLGQPLPWIEFQHARDLKARLKELEDSKRTAVIRKLLMNYDLYAEAQEKRRKKGKDKKQDGKPQTIYGVWNWRILYLLRRNLNKDDPEHRSLMDNFHISPDKSVQPDFARLEWVGVAARWEELEDR